MFRFIAERAAHRDVAWDCATGNGQAALALARHFDRVIATDASSTQLQAAPPHPKIEYRLAAAEASGLAAESVDAITVAQALHWFDIERFFEEAVRVLAPGGVLAVWCYENCTVDPDCDRVIERLFDEVDPYWLPERTIVDDGYRSIELPLGQVHTPAFEIELDWFADDALGYFRTWSATRRYMGHTGADPVNTIADDLNAAWGNRRRSVRWPIAIRMCRK